MKNRYLLIILFAGVLLAGCRKNEPPDPVDTDPKTFIMFGNLGSYYSGNIESAGSAVAAGALIEGQRLVVYQDMSPENRLYEIVRDATQTDGYRKELIKTYDRTVSSFDPQRMRTILQDAIAAAPANHYGLSIGSHGTSWLHTGIYKPSDIHQSKKAVVMHSAISAELEEFMPLLVPKGEDTETRNMNHELDIEKLPGIFEGLGLDFILLDQCFMGAIEVIYELRNSAPYLIVSPAEVLIYGFPYAKVVKSLFSDWSNLSAVCHQFADHYKNDGVATVSLINTSKINSLAAAAKAIVNNGVNLNVKQADIQVYYSKGMFYDFQQYVEKLSKNSVLTQEFIDRLDEVVEYTETNGYYYSRIPLKYYSGLTTYVPDPTKYPIFYTSYQKTSWYKFIKGIE